MSQTFEFYHARAEESATEAEAAQLDNVRDRALRSEATWRGLAEQARKVAEDRVKAEHERSLKRAAEAEAVEERAVEERAQEARNLEDALEERSSHWSPGSLAPRLAPHRGPGHRSFRQFVHPPSRPPRRRRRLVVEATIAAFRDRLNLATT